MTERQKDDYERAAVALETRAILPSLDDMYPSDIKPWMEVFWKAWDMCNEQDPVGVTIRETDVHAARLLRECIANDVPLAAVDGTRGGGR